MKIEIDGKPVETWAAQELGDGTRVVTVHLPPEPRHDCACTEFDDGSSFKLSAFAGGGSKGGAFSTVFAAHKKPDGTNEIIHYIRDRNADIIGSILARSVAERRQFLHDLVEAINGVERIGREERRDDRRHDLYETGDADAPESIKDRNGEVALGLCRRCGRGESELLQECPGPRETPADKLADAVEAFISVTGNRRPIPGVTDIPQRTALYAALDGYRSTRNGVGATAAEVIGSPPDSIRVARLLLDSLTGGALSSLIALTRDSIQSGLHWHETENIAANLRALGEKVEG